MEEPIHNQQSFILNQLSKIGESLAVNTTETSNVKESLKKIESSLTSMNTQLGSQNEKIIKFEGWSIEATKILDAVAKSSLDYQVNKTRLWTGIALIIFFGATIITLGTIVVKGWIKETVDTAFFNKDDIESIKEIK